jgi:hypothetical protein
MPETTNTVDVKTAIQRGDADVLRRLLAEDPSRANTPIRWGENDHLKTPPLHFVSDMIWDGTLAFGREIRIIEVLIAAGADLNAQNGSPLNAAASLGAEDVGIRLLEAGARADLVGLFGETALHWAAHLGASHLADRLVQAGSPLDARDQKYHSTPLGWAMHGWRSLVPLPWVKAGIAPRHVEIVARLVKAGAVVEPSWIEAEDVRADGRMLAALEGRSF